MTTSSGLSQPASPAQPSAAASALSAARTHLAILRNQVTQLRGQVESAETAEARSNTSAQWAAARDQIRTTLLGVQPDDLFTGLEANVPLVLLPVRLETCFAVDGSSVLHVRIFPDDVHIDGHDEELTSTEATLGAAMWAGSADILAFGETAPTPLLGPDLPDGRRARWVSLVNMLGGPRAAWVARATRPAQSAGGATAATPPTKPQAYVRPAVARALPDRWLVRAYADGVVVGQAWTSAVGVDLHMAPDPQATSPASAATTGTGTDGAPGTGATSSGTTGTATSAGATTGVGSSASATASPALPSVDPEMHWMVDYQTAVNIGMAVDVPLPAGTESIDRLVAVGVRASTSSADSVTELAGLLTAHRYTDGLGFLPPGSQTSNTPDARSALDRQADPDRLWQQEFGPPAGVGTAAAILAAALGLPSGIVDGSPNSGDAGDAQAAAMQTALWSATWGYYLGQLIDPTALRGVTVEGVRDHYRKFVRGRGTMPTLRLGRQPYGVLPLLPLDRWVSDGASTTVDGLAWLLTRVRPLWQYGVGLPVTASEGPGFDQAFTTVMSTDAVGRIYQIRSALADRTFDPLIFTGIDTKPGHGVIDTMIGNLLTLGSNPLILDVFSATAQPVRAPLVVDPTDPTPDSTVRAAILGLAAANPTVALVNAAFLKPRSQGPATVLHTLLRRSLLLEYAAAGIGLTKIGATTQRTPVISTGITSSPIAATPESPLGRPQPAGSARPTGPAEHIDLSSPASSADEIPVAQSGSAQSAGTPPGSAAQPTGAGQAAVVSAPVPASMLFGLSPDAAGGFTPVQSMPTALTTPVTAVTGQLAAGEWLWRNPTSEPNLRRDLDQTLAAFDLLANVSAADLDLLLRETLDLTTHRWTAWAESAATDKLARLRAATPAGVTLGGWGIVERLTRRQRVAADPSQSAAASGGPLWADERPGGFVHAPSTAQAGTAAVLRAAHLAHGGESDPSCAIDLSSAPARAAQRLSDGIRSGQELGALLGYEMERYLHKNSADVLIAPLRAYAPRWQAGGTFVEGNPKEIVSPSAVVDGLALADADPSAVAKAVLPTGASAAALAAALSSGLAMLRSQQDALADLLTAEGIHHVLTSNADRAGAALSAAHRGGLPPDDYDVLRTPRSGASLTCRVGVLLPASGSALAGGWPNSPRGGADRSCAAWLASVLPAVAAVRVRVANAAGVVSAIALPATAGLGPLDVVLDRPEVVRTRIEAALPAGTTVLTGREPAWTPSTVGLDELLTVAADLREVLSARAMRSTDLLMAGAAAGAADERDAADLLARLTAARSSLQQAAQAVAAAAGPLATAAATLATGGQSAPSLAAALSAARTALSATLAHGVVLQLDPAAAPADVLAVLGAATAELTRRLALPVPAGAASADELVNALRGLLGANQPAVPRLLIDTGTAAVAVAGLAAGDGFVAAAPDLAADWLDDVAGVRASTGHLVTALQGCDALTVGAGLTDGWRIVEPSGHQAAWTATLDAEALASLGPVATIVLDAAAGATLAAGSYAAGLIVDEWVEVVPLQTAATSVAYQADAPVARAPQAILLGMAPNVPAGWNADIVVDLALEALSMAGLRTVDVETGAWLGRMLPAILLPDGDASEVIAAPPLPLLQVDVEVLESARATLKGLG